MSQRRSQAPRAVDMRHAAFVRAYLANGGNATDAYQTVHPKVTRGTAAVMGWRALRNPKIATLIRAAWHKVLAQRKIDVETVIGMVACEAEADVTQLYDAHGKMLPPHQWPRWMTHCIEAIDLREDGTGRIKLASQSQARKFLLELFGRTRTVADSFDAMAEAILADRAKHLPQGDTR